MTGIRIDALDAVASATRDHVVPAMNGGATVKLTVGQILDLLIDSAPGSLDTLDELAAALGDDENFATTMTTALAARMEKSQNLADLENVGTALTNLGFSSFVQGLKAAADAAAFRAAIGVSFKGAQVCLSANEPITTSTATAISWDSEIEDVGGWWDAGTPTRFTVPSGVNRVRLTANVRWDAVAAGLRSAEIYKNGSPGWFASANDDGSSAGTHQNLATAAVPVVSGDYFTLVVTHTRGSDLDLIDAVQTFFAIEAV